jgi:hypothetical protein
MRPNGLVNLAISRLTSALFIPTVTLRQQFPGPHGKMINPCLGWIFSQAGAT